MKNNNFLLLRRILGILIAVSIVVAGICFIYACLSIYNSGGQPYSREAVSNAFDSISIPVYCCLVLTALGIIAEFVLPDNAKKEKNIPNNRAILEKLTSKRDVQGNSEAFKKIQIERKFRKNNLTITYLAIVAAVIGILVYSLLPDSFHSDEINQSIIKAIRLILRYCFILFCYSVYALYANERSIKREIAILKQLPVLSSPKNIENKEKNNVKTEKYVKYGILAFALIILVFGFAFGGTEDVLTKAVNICTECIGLG